MVRGRFSNLILLKKNLRMFSAETENQFPNKKIHTRKDRWNAIKLQMNTGRDTSIINMVIWKKIG